MATAKTMRNIQTVKPQENSLQTGERGGIFEVVTVIRSDIDSSERLGGNSDTETREGRRKERADLYEQKRLKCRRQYDAQSKK